MTDDLRALLPLLLLVLGLLASGRVGALVAGLAGPCRPRSRSRPCSSLRAGRRTAPGRPVAARDPGGALARLAGHRHHRRRHVLPPLPARARHAADGGDTLPATPRRLWSVCFLLAPFAEAVTGFGVGYIIALAALRRLGLGGLPALLLGLYSQSLVPWGALATGTTVGATLAGLTPNQLGLGSALLQMPIHVSLPRCSTGASRAQAGVPVASRRRSTTSLGRRCCSALVWLANRYSDVEIAGAAPTALAAGAALLARRAAGPCRPARRAASQRALCRAHRGALRHAAGAAAARSPEAAVGAEALRQPAGLRAALRAGLLADLDRRWSCCCWRAPRSAASSPTPRAAPGAPAP